jgi:CRP/FNR family transcriptional regulator
MDTWQHALRTTLVDRMLWPAETAAAITQIAHIVEYEKGASVFHPGEPTDLLYLLLSGEARLYYGTASGERLLVHIVRGGQILGFTDFRVKDPHEHDSGQVFLAEVQSRSRVAIIAAARVAAHLCDLPGPELVRVVESVESRWAHLCVRLLTLLTMDVRSRLAYVIHEIARMFGITDARGKLISIRLSHEDFGELVGASRPMISKHLKELAKAGIFVKEEGRYLLLREDLLKKMLTPGIVSPMPAVVGELLGKQGREPRREVLRGTAVSNARH